MAFRDGQRAPSPHAFRVRRAAYAKETQTDDRTRQDKEARGENKVTELRLRNTDRDAHDYNLLLLIFGQNKIYTTIE